MPIANASNVTIYMHMQRVGYARTILEIGISEEGCALCSHLKDLYGKTPPSCG